MNCVHDFPQGEVSVKVGVMEFGLNRAYCYANLAVSSLASTATITSTHFAYQLKNSQAQSAHVT